VVCIYALLFLVLCTVIKAWSGRESWPWYSC